MEAASILATRRSSYLAQVSRELARREITIPSTVSEIVQFFSTVKIAEIRSAIENHFHLSLVRRVLENAARKCRLSFLVCVRPSLSRFVFLDCLQNHQASNVIRMLTSGHHMRIETGRMDNTPKEEKRSTAKD